VAELNIVIKNESGLHARPASDFVNLTKTFAERVSITAKGKTLNAKSILHVLSLSLKQGDSATITVDGDNAEDILNQIAEFLDGLSE